MVEWMGVARWLAGFLHFPDGVDLSTLPGGGDGAGAGGCVYTTKQASW